MTDVRQCYYTHCDRPTRWSVQTETAFRNPDGSPILLYACDAHCPALTKKCRDARRRYLMAPYNQQSWEVMHTCSKGSEVDIEKKIKGLPFLLRIAINGAIIIVGVVIAPAIITYYLVRVLVYGKNGLGGPKKNG